MNNFNIDFRAAWWLNSPHLQTLWPMWFRRKHRLNVNLERLELDDGDFLDLTWIGKGNAPIVLVLHGLSGNVNTSYANAILHAIQSMHWRGVLMHFRGCSGVPNRLARSYHGGQTEDLSTVIHTIRKREPTTPIYLVGYSLGANVLLKALGEGKINKHITAAVAVSVPFELAKTAEYMCVGLRRVYQKILVQRMVRSIQEKIKHISMPIDLQNLAKYSTFFDFDDAITAPLHGFRNADEYYSQSSCRQYLKKIQTPTLILQAKDDPFTPLDALPETCELSKHVQLELSASGGHVGFIAGKKPWRPVYWLENRIMDFFKMHQDQIT